MEFSIKADTIMILFVCLFDLILYVPSTIFKLNMDGPFFLSLYTARPSFEYYRQVYFVHSGLQDKSLQVTISKLP